MEVSLELQADEAQEAGMILLERNNIIAYFHRCDALAH